MDWEKQDNELRKLMETSDFLPDAERWDAKAVWTKLQHKKQSTHGKAFATWVLWATAACVIGLLGVGLLWYQQSNSYTHAGAEISDATKGNGQNSNINQAHEAGEIIHAVRQSVLQNKIGDFKQEPAIIAKKETTGKNADLQQEKNIFEKSDLTTSTSNQNEDPLNTKGKPEITLVQEQVSPTAIVPFEQALKSLAAVPAPAKKTKIRVVHYNELQGKQSTSPPVFVQTKKPLYEWDGLVIQNSSLRKEPAFQLKIDISPAPKKSF